MGPHQASSAGGAFPAEDCLSDWGPLSAGPVLSLTGYIRENTNRWAPLQNNFIAAKENLTKDQFLAGFTYLVGALEAFKGDEAVVVGLKGGIGVPFFFDKSVKCIVGRL